ncbi:Two component system response regulator reciever and HD domains-containing protein [Desulfonema limicola]|uniref:Two component system response regulator reciever and HD domains-containing protein n=1 Tax=Desulfonema limicola TaxID=45656 RepID=A0A975B6V3_9BACT|nr:two-component system response regulator [Desulfonema limicola]QTA79891.1 Two component system response regulator reciever and HD domains-containing protein [Desulfonema limicola]
MEKAEQKILIVDDERFNINILVGILKTRYRTIIAKNGEEALKRAVTSTPPDLILLDIMMPEMDGYEVCKRLKQAEETAHIPVIFITAMGQEENETKGFEVGAVDYITKPVQPEIVRARVKTHLELINARKQLQNQNLILEQKVHERTRELRDSRQEIIHRLVSAAEHKDPETGSHIKRMSHYSALLARAYGFNEKECEAVLLAASMHDIGKIGIPDYILLKKGRLDLEEWEIMKTHSSIGAKILSKSKSKLIREGQVIAVSHHEKWDGSGYPQKLKGEAIPITGRIAALADVFDALTTKRPYKEPWPVNRAADEIKAGSGSHFEPRLVEIFINILPDLLKIKERFPEET